MRLLLCLMLSLLALPAPARRRVSPDEQYKYLMARATVYASRGLFERASRQLERAARIRPTAVVQCELGKVALRLVLRSDGRDPLRKGRPSLLERARLHFERCRTLSRKEKSVRLERIAKAGLRDLVRIERLRR